MREIIQSKSIPVKHNPTKEEKELKTQYKNEATTKFKLPIPEKYKCKNSYSSNQFRTIQEMKLQTQENINLNQFWRSTNARKHQFKSISAKHKSTKGVKEFKSRKKLQATYHYSRAKSPILAKYNTRNEATAKSKSIPDLNLQMK
ncbi:5558_t:CDS:2 [Scutellospora calospora]|uniref:5558_t:CDS:1 n=1 Tax=Scutellospora calospora TaxID=85575 RepID=A0ACA9JV95_9GLOM|nr:5558_t:CDS:2 [Scutellospora calospora]